jgi:phytoene dehydrogenase-like protein
VIKLQSTPIDKLVLCGAGVFPGIGVPPVGMG